MNAPENGALRKKLTVKVIGVGGAGCNLVNHLAQVGPAEIDLAALNTDSQALANCNAPQKIVLGAKKLRGFGAGGDPEIGRQSALENLDEIKALCAGADIVFIAAGMGGGTGTGASPIIAEAAREAGALALGIVTLPFEFEGSRRQREAQMGLRELQAAADAVICLPNQRVLKIADSNASIVEAFKQINELLEQGIAGIWRMLSQPGLINVDFADLCAVTKNQHSQNYFATVETEGADRCENLLKSLFSHPLFENGVLEEADALLISICSGSDLTMREVDLLMSTIHERTKCSRVLIGAAIDESFSGRISLTLIASHLQMDAAFIQDEHKRERVGNASRISENVESFQEPAPTRAPSRFVPPAPELAEEKREKIISKQMRDGKTAKKSGWRQAQLPLDIVSRGRFEKSEPTIHQGADLDVPTYIRLGIQLN